MWRLLFPLFVIGFIGFLFVANKDRILYSLSPQASINPDSLNGNYDLKINEGVFDNKIVQIPFDPPEVKMAMKNTNILGATSDNKRIEVDLTNQKLYAFEGDRKVYDFLISSGKWGKTPTGTFQIWTKLRATRMTGGLKEIGTFYDLPNVPYTMFFANSNIPASRGFGIHGTYWHSNFGHPMSHGCINMKTEEAAELYYWANPTLTSGQSTRATPDNPGTPVVIYGTAPNT